MQEIAVDNYTYRHRKYEQNSVFLFAFRKGKGFFCTIPDSYLAVNTGESASSNLITNMHARGAQVVFHG